jgi:hypothetical protein
LCGVSASGKSEIEEGRKERVRKMELKLGEIGEWKKMWWVSWKVVGSKRGVGIDDGFSMFAKR